MIEIIIFVLNWLNYEILFKENSLVFKKKNLNAKQSKFSTRIMKKQAYLCLENKYTTEY
jgi:hypothetical protein